MSKKNSYIVVGAGPAGLSAAYEAQKYGCDISIFERSSHMGGLVRTLQYKDCRYDIGTHRFYTLNKEINDFYNNILGNDKLEVKRLSRILHDKKFFLYPLSPFNTLLNLGIYDATLMMLSYLNALIKRKLNLSKIKNYEDWVISNFGYRLYKSFFKSYTEKVWGINCTEISDEWAAQRIKNLSFFSVIINPIKKKFSKKKIKSLIESFYYPKTGAGLIYEKMANIILKNKGKIFTEHNLVKIKHDNYKIISLVFKNKNNELIEKNADYYFTSCPFTEIITMLDPKPPKEVLDSGKKLQFRHHVGVNLEIHGKIFKDNWIYVHDDTIKIARVVNYKSFSKYMSPNEDQNPVTVEYFSFEDEFIWQSTDEELVKYAEMEMRKAGIINDHNKIMNGFVVRSKNSYPVIKKDYDIEVKTIKEYLDKFKNIIPIGRSGMFKYNNQDHAMATGMYAARNIEDENFNVDIWKINSEGIYVEGDSEDV